MNSPTQTVLSGPRDLLEKVQQQLQQQGKKARLLGDYPFHHSSIKTQELTEALQGVSLSRPSIPYLSNVSGTWITHEQATNPNYWTNRIHFIH